MQTEAVIFDCDGTLVNSEVLGNEVLVKYLSEFGLVMTFEEAHNRYKGGKMADILNDAEKELGKKLPDHFVTEFRRQLAIEITDRLEAIPGTHETLEQITLPIAVASNAPMEKIQLALKVTGLKKFFGDQIFSAYEIDSWKPSPDLFLHAAKSLGIHPEKCIAVEDSVAGVQSALAAGMRVIAYVANRDDKAPEGAIPIYDMRDLIDLI